MSAGLGATSYLDPWCSLGVVPEPDQGWTAAHQLRYASRPAAKNRRSRSKRPRFANNGAHKSPIAFTRAGTLSMRKSSVVAPCSSSFQVRGADTVALGLGRGEYTQASV